MNSPQKISFDCPSCASFQSIELQDLPDSLNFKCGHCPQVLEFKDLHDFPFKNCSVCGCEQLYQHKDFNKKIGLLIFVIGALLIPYTYALSLLAALALDALLYPFFGWMQICYFCHSEFRGFAKNPNLDSFDHETAAKYEYGSKKWISP